MSNLPYGSGSPKSFHAYPRRDLDLESGIPRKSRKPKPSLPTMLRSIGNHIRAFYKMHPLAVFLISLLFGLTVFILLSLYKSRFRVVSSMRVDGDDGMDSGTFPLSNLRRLVMVVGYSVYTSTGCGEVDSEESWYLEPYQKHPGQAASFVEHIKNGVEITARDEEALLLFSGGETRKDAGPRSEAQSYWAIAESKGWFGKDTVRNRALTEEHARDSFENLLFSVCRFRELTGTYPQNITKMTKLSSGKSSSISIHDTEIDACSFIEVVSYDFKKERFAQFHRSAIGFPEGSFSYYGTPSAPSSNEAAMKGEEALVRAQFQVDPYGCTGSLHQKRLKRDPFHRYVPYPIGCPELRGLFRYCAPSPYLGILPWEQ